MNPILLILVLLLIFGTGGFYTYHNIGPQYGYGFGGIGGLVLIVIIILALTGRL